MTTYKRLTTIEMIADRGFTSTNAANKYRAEAATYVEANRTEVKPSPTTTHTSS